VKTILTTLNAKYIHTSLALRLLYAAAADRFDISFREYTLKEDPETVVRELLAAHPDVIGISVSIWNVEKSGEVIRLLKACKPGVILVLGGPEVTYDAEYFLSIWPVDYIVKGEGEFAFCELLACIEKGEDARIRGVSSKNCPDRHILKADLAKIEKLPSPYALPEEESGWQDRLVYVETSRGCPYGCTYCLSSLEKGVRYHSPEHIARHLRYLLENGVRQIKFLDRTFNLNREHTAFVFDFLIRNYRPGVSCQFEIYADLLTEKTIRELNERLPAGYFRFEIGVQSTYEPANEAVNRRQDFARLARNVRLLAEGGKIDLHIDLIAGLPHETMERFICSFNDVFDLKAKEVQLGFLKLLRGTELRKEASRYGYEYTAEAPYEIRSNHAMSCAALERIREAEHALELFWNSGRFPRTMAALTERWYRQDYFRLFDELASWLREYGLPKQGYQLEDLFRCLAGFLERKEAVFGEELQEDYYSHFTVRPHGFRPDRPDKKVRRQWLHRIGNDAVFLKTHGLARENIEKHAALDLLPDGSVRLTLFLPDTPKGGHRTLSYPAGL
jgi:radical SAM superfamily enzyme YgiQ (UPF0313 family)